MGDWLRRSRTVWLAAVFVVAAAAALGGAPALRAQQPAPSGSPPSGSGGSDTPKSLTGIAPKSIVVDPCKAKDPPSYCGKR